MIANEIVNVTEIEIEIAIVIVIEIVIEIAMEIVIEIPPALGLEWFRVHGLVNFTLSPLIFPSGEGFTPPPTPSLGPGGGTHGWSERSFWSQMAPRGPN